MSTKRILLIDDEKDLSDVIQTCLRKLGGWNVLTAQSGSEGLEKAGTEQPDAILLDVMMPDMDGFTVLHKLKGNPATQNIPIILLTAKVQPADQNNYALLGIAGVITKPFDPLKISHHVAEKLGWSSEAV